MSTEYLVHVSLQHASRRNWSSEIQHEYDTAVRDLLHENTFHLCKNVDGNQVVGPYTERGPYGLYLTIQDNRLMLDIRRMILQDDNSYQEKKREKCTLPMSPFRRIIKDYFMICESYFDGVRSHINPMQLETVDMARRGIHNEGSELLQERLLPQIEVDIDTARRLFTLICILHIR